MKLIYSNPITTEYFSVQHLSQFIAASDFSKPHPWFTILVFNTFQENLRIDDFDVNSKTANATFLTPGQHFSLESIGDLDGFAVSFNKPFYCVEYHDKDVSCNGLLFVNNFSCVQIELDIQQLTAYNATIMEMAAEFENLDEYHVEMLKNLLKNLLIRSSRLFRQQNTVDAQDENTINFVRKFSELVEKHFKQHKEVEKYALMLGIAPATLTKKLQKFGIESPSRIIKNRIITEAKRLFMYTDKSVKEISYIIGFDDQYYFSRLFKKEVGTSPSDYKKQLNRL